MDIAQALATKLRADAVILSLLPSGANGIILAETLMTGRVPDAVTLPCIAVQDMGDSGGVNALPLIQTVIHLRVYDNAQPNALTYININRIMDECLRCLHRVPFTSQMSYQTLYEVWYDNYRSPASFDDLLKLPFRVIRFRAYSSSNLYDQRGYV